MVSSSNVQILSVTTDVLIGAETLMHSLLSRLETDLAITMSSLQCLKLEPVLRKKIAEAIVPTSKMKV